MQVQEIEFKKFKSEVKEKEGIVCLGAGGSSDEWIKGITDILNKEEIVKGTPDEIWSAIYKLVTTGGRIDLAFVMKPEAKFDIGKMAIWRIRFGDCSWISDYLVNYANHH